MMPYSKYTKEVYVILKGKVEAIRGKIFKQLQNSCYAINDYGGAERWWGGGGV